MCLMGVGVCQGGGFYNNSIVNIYVYIHILYIYTQNAPSQYFTKTMFHEKSMGFLRGSEASMSHSKGLASS